MDCEHRWVLRQGAGAVAMECEKCSHLLSVERYVGQAESRVKTLEARNKDLEVVGNKMKRSLRFLMWGGVDEVVEWCQLTGQPLPEREPKGGYEELEAAESRVKALEAAGDAMVGAMNRAGLGGVEGVHWYLVKWCKLTGQLHQERVTHCSYADLMEAGNELVRALQRLNVRGSEEVLEWRRLTGQLHTERSPAPEPGCDHRWGFDAGFVRCLKCNDLLSEDNCGAMFDMSACVTGRDEPPGADLTRAEAIEKASREMLEKLRRMGLNDMQRGHLERAVTALEAALKQDVEPVGTLGELLDLMICWAGPEGDMLDLANKLKELRRRTPCRTVHRSV